MYSFYGGDTAKIATPPMKRVSVIGTVMIVFLYLYIMYMQYMAHAEGATESAQNAIDVQFQCLQLLLPLLVWIIANPTFITTQAE